MVQPGILEAFHYGRAAPENKKEKFNEVLVADVHISFMDEIRLIFYRGFLSVERR